MERSNHGYNRCLKQESAQSITWIGQPETKFTFDHVACETVDQVCLEKELPSVHFSTHLVIKFSSSLSFVNNHISASQEMLFRMAGLPMVENCLSGYNSCMFAYGQVKFLH